MEQERKGVPGPGLPPPLIFALADSVSFNTADTGRGGGICTKGKGLNIIGISSVDDNYAPLRIRYNKFKM